MYKCNECDRIFEHPSTRSVHSEYWGAPKTDFFSVCPYCKEEDFDEYEEEEDA